jgi:hypothetical protein
LLAEARQTRANRDPKFACRVVQKPEQHQRSRRRSLDDTGADMSTEDHHTGRRNSAPTINESVRGGSKRSLSRQGSPNSVILVTPDPSGDKMEIDGSDESLPNCLNTSRRSGNTEHRRSTSMPTTSQNMYAQTLSAARHNRRASASHVNAHRQQRTVDFAARYSRHMYT